MTRTAPKARRAALLICGALILLLLASPRPAAASEATAGISIVNGKTTKIGKWPWQVALTVARRVAPQRSTTNRFFCGGSLLAPKLVITAGHCVADLTRGQIRKIEIVSGRTRLNANGGQIASVSEVVMPRTPSGKRRYRTFAGAADWDVALLRLSSPLSAETIKLAGADESASWAPGQITWTTGWGVTRGFSKRASPILRVAAQVMLPDGVCRRADGRAFRSLTMNCIGGPNANSSTCSGDSGGPLVARTSLGYRLVGLTSYGDGGCRGNTPSVDTRVAGETLRDWVAATAMALEGVDVLGTGGASPPTPEWCSVPAVFGLKLPQAAARLNSRGCRLGRVKVDPYGAGPSGRIIGFSRVPGWLAPIGGRVDVWISP